jgi:hypothetical protein
MRLRFAVPALLLTVLVVAAVPAVGSAAPKHNRGLTINVTPNPIVTGDPVLIYGQLGSSNPAHKLVVLYQRVNPAGHFTLLAATTTDSFGFYDFKRTDATTNRSYYVVSQGGLHSRTAYERVAAEVSLSASASTPDTNHPVVFTGHVKPELFHVGEHVYLQAQSGPNGDDWHTLKVGTIDANSNYSITYRFLTAGERELRVLFRGDVRNAGAASDVETVTVEQAQNPSFTIHSSAQAITAGGSAVISGVLYKNAAGTVVDPGQPVQLWGHERGAPYVVLQSATTGTNGAYTFTVTPAHNVVYQVRTVPPSVTTPIRATAQLFEAVRYGVTLTASSPTAVVGQPVTLSGTVAPPTSGHAIYLQRLGADNEWHTVKVGLIQTGSTYQFTWRFGSAGTHVFRTVVPGDAFNASGHSPAVTIPVSQPPVSVLPTAPFGR